MLSHVMLLSPPPRKERDLHVDKPLGWVFHKFIDDRVENILYTGVLYVVVTCVNLRTNKPIYA